MTLQELHRRLSGEIHHPGSPAYDEARAPVQLDDRAPPALVVRCSSPEDVADALAYAREHGLEIAVRAGGHSVAGHVLVDDGLVIDVRGLRERRGRPGAPRRARRRRAHLGRVRPRPPRSTASPPPAGACRAPASPASRSAAAPAGSSASTAWRATTSLAVELVTADGELVRASATRAPRPVLGAARRRRQLRRRHGVRVRAAPGRPGGHGRARHPPRRARPRAAARSTATSMHDAPDELSLAFVYLTAPDGAGDPRGAARPPGRGDRRHARRPIDEGDRGAARDPRSSAPAADLFEPMPYADFQCALDDPPGYRNWWTAEHLTTCPTARSTRS